MRIEYKHAQASANKAARTAEKVSRSTVGFKKINKEDFLANLERERYKEHLQVMNTVYGDYHEKLKARAKKDAKAAKERGFVLDDKAEQERLFREKLESLNEYDDSRKKNLQRKDV